jgi:hypothetical protein
MNAQKHIEAHLVVSTALRLHTLTAVQTGRFRDFNDFNEFNGFNVLLRSKRDVIRRDRNGSY